MSSTLIIVIVVSVIVFIGLLCCVGCAVSCKKKPSDATGARIPASNTEASAPYAAQPGVTEYPPPPPVQPHYQLEVNPYPSPSVSYAPLPKNPHMEAATSPYPPYPPPPYPGDETAPQYPPPGQTYPWQHNTPPKPSSSPERP